ncbi:hypothetical protein H0H92_013035, partial [Tricholoma furcatifolium]
SISGGRKCCHSFGRRRAAPSFIPPLDGELRLLETRVFFSAPVPFHMTDPQLDYEMARRKGSKGEKAAQPSNKPSKAPKRSGRGWTMVSVPNSDDDQEIQAEVPTALPPGPRQTRSTVVAQSTCTTPAAQPAEPSRPRPRPRPRPKATSPANEQEKECEPFIIRRSTGVPTTSDSSLGISASGAAAPSEDSAVPPASIPVAASARAPQPIITVNDSVIPPASLDPSTLFDDPNLIIMPELPAQHEPSLPP